MITAYLEPFSYNITNENSILFQKTDQD